MKRLLFCGLLANAVVAPLSLAGQLEELIVTAQKREQSQLDVGIAITAFNAELINRLEVVDSVEIARHTPGLMVGVPVGEGNNPNFTLRGVGINDYADSNEGPVAVYVDGAYSATLAGLSFQLFDLERVEVLRGPQGTLFGRNATGGLIQYVTVKPRREFSASAAVTLAEDQQLKTEAAVGGAVGEHSALRLAVASNRHDGKVKNSLGENGNDADSQAARLQWLWVPDSALDVLVKLHGSRSDSTGPRYAHRASFLDAEGVSHFLPSNVDAYGSCSGCDIYGYRDNDGNPFTVAQDMSTGLRINNHTVSTTINWQRGDVRLSSVTDYAVVDKRYDEEVDGGPNPAFWAEYHLDAEQFSQEFRAQWQLANALWTSGLYYFNHDLGGRQRAVASFNMGSWTPVLDSNPDWQQETESWALFGQAEIDLSEQWRLIAGLRYTDESKGFEQVVADPLVPPFNSNFTPGQPGFSNIEDDYFSGKLQLEWRPQAGSMSYAGVSRGVKGGGFNTGFIFDLPNENIPYDKETLTSYEVGLKQDLLDGRYIVSAAAFYYDYNDFQAFQQVSTQQFFFNANAKHRGVDLSLEGTPTARFDFSLALSYLHAEAENIGLPSAGSADRKMVFAPEFSAYVRLRYNWLLAPGRLSLQADMDYADEHYFHIYNAPSMKQSARTVFNARLVFDSADQHWQAAAWVKNLGDKQYRNYALDFTGLGGYTLAMYAPQRHAGVTLRYHW